MLYFFILVAFIVGMVVGWFASKAHRKEETLNISELLINAFDLGVSVATRHDEEQNVNKEKSME